MCPEMDGVSQVLPGFRFHPTEEELLDFYLKNMVFGKMLQFDVIGFLNIYRHDPKDLPGLAKIGEREWYFFVPRDRKQGSGGRPNRTTEKGFWKATGSDRKILKSSDPKRVIGLRKTLVFYKGRAPRGSKTDWVMNEYRLPDNNTPLPKEVVLCKIYRKATSLKVLEQRAANAQQNVNVNANENANAMSYSSSSSIEEETITLKVKEEEEMMMTMKQHSNNMDMMMITPPLSSSSTTLLNLPLGLAELQVPRLTSSDWNQMESNNWTLPNSPWLQNLTPSFYASFNSVSN